MCEDRPRALQMTVQGADVFSRQDKSLLIPRDARSCHELCGKNFRISKPTSSCRQVEVPALRQGHVPSPSAAQFLTSLEPSHLGTRGSHGSQGQFVIDNTTNSSQSVGSRRQVMLSLEVTKTYVQNDC